MKAVIFDFDGTLTKKSQNVWKQVWEALGYETKDGSYYRQLFRSFLNSEITHKRWCELTCEAFKAKGLTKDLLTSIGEEIKLLDGFEETMITLKKNGYSLHIVSGNIGLVIANVIMDKAKYFDSINSNYFEFDKDGKLLSVKGTNYDFEGKAKFINEFKEKYNISAKNITFIGNGDNDEWAYKSGCNTICVNPDRTDADNKVIWHNAVKELVNLKQVLPIITRSQDHAQE